MNTINEAVETYVVDDEIMYMGLFGYTLEVGRKRQLLQYHHGVTSPEQTRDEFPLQQREKIPTQHQKRDVVPIQHKQGEEVPDQLHHGQGEQIPTKHQRRDAVPIQHKQGEEVPDQLHHEQGEEVPIT